MNVVNENLGHNINIEHIAIQDAQQKANIGKWSLNVVVFLFTILITIIVLTAQGIGIKIVAPIAVFALVAVWTVGTRQWNQLFKLFYAEELSKIQVKMQERPSEETIALLSKLSPQELEILNYITQGHINRQIAFKLKISESAVKSHITSIFIKMKAHDRTEAAIIAIKHGLISGQSTHPSELSPI
ncbi:response regulator transcription factor [Chloroflexota bacterium]